MHIHATVTIHRSQERTSKSYGIDRRMNILIANVKRVCRKSEVSGSSSYLGTDRHFITSCRVGPGPTRRERESRDSSTSTARCEKKGSTPRERGRFSFRRSGRKQVTQQAFGTYRTGRSIYMWAFSVVLVRSRAHTRHVAYPLPCLHGPDVCI